MIRLIFFLIVLAAFSSGAAWLLQHRGAVEVIWLGYQVKTSMFVIASALALGVLALLLAVRLTLGLFSLPERRREARQVRRMDRALLALSRGFAALAVADGRTARQASGEAQKLLAHHRHGAQLVHILAAEAAQMEGNPALANEHFSALREHKSTKALALQGMLVSAQQAGETEKALELAEEAWRLRPEGKGNARILLSLYKRAGAWESAQSFLDRYTRRTRWKLTDTTPEFNKEEELAAILVMRARAVRESDAAKALVLAAKAAKLCPGFLPAVLLAAQLAEVKGDKPKAAILIERAWPLAPARQLGELYAKMLEGEKPKARIRRALKLAALNPDHPESHRVMALAHLSLQDYVAAHNHAELAVAEGETASLCELLAQIAEKSDAPGAKEKAGNWRKRAERAAPDPAWGCTACGAAATEWDPVCPSCQAVDKVTWRNAPKSAVKYVAS